MKRHSKSLFQVITYLAIVLFCVSVGHSLRTHQAPTSSTCQPQPNPPAQ